MSYRKNATTLVIKNPKKRDYGGNAYKKNKAMSVYIPKRNQRSFLHQTDLGTGPEKKNLDVYTTFAPPLASAFSTPQCLNLVSVGTQPNQRVGRKIIIKSVFYRANLFPNAPASQHRIVIFYDKQANGAAPALTDIFQANSVVSPLHLARSDRFVIVCDEMSDSSQSSALNISNQRHVKCNLETIFNTTNDGAIGSIDSGALWMTMANNGGTITGAVTSADVYARIRYVDF